MKKQELEMTRAEEIKETRAPYRRMAICAAAFGAFYRAVTALFQTVFAFSCVPSGSMEGSVRAGDFLISSRYGVGAGEFESSFAKGPPDRSGDGVLRGAGSL